METWLEGKKSPEESQGTVVGWTDEFSTIHGDPNVGEFPEIVRVQFPGIPGPKNYRMGFADEHWLVLVSGGTHREKKIFGKDLENSSCMGQFFALTDGRMATGESVLCPSERKKGREEASRVEANILESS